METPERGVKCPWNVVIEEDSTFTNEDLCGNRRDTHIYTSETNSLQVYFNFIETSDIPSFGIKYEGKRGTHIIIQSVKSQVPKGRWPESASIGAVA